jgi:hypothetical protein
MHARYYNPSMGRFLSADPLRGSMTPRIWSRYAYVLGNPVSYTDPWGLVERKPGEKMEENDTCDGVARDGICYAGRLDGSTTVIGSPIPPRPMDAFLPSRLWFSSIGTGGDGGVKQTAKLAWSDFKNEFKDGGCVAVFLDATVDALNPFTPSLTTLAEPVAFTAATFKYNAAVRYAASRPNFLGGTGLIYPMKSSVVRSMLADANMMAGSAAWLTVDLAVVNGLIEEGKAMMNGTCQ